MERVMEGRKGMKEGKEAERTDGRKGRRKGRKGEMEIGKEEWKEVSK